MMKDRGDQKRGIFLIRYSWGGWRKKIEYQTVYKSKHIFE